MTRLSGLTVSDGATARLECGARPILVQLNGKLRRNGQQA